MKRKQRKRIAVIFGTRPDTIKLASVILALRNQARLFRVVTIATAQHRHMLDQVLDVFAIRPEHDLNLMLPRQSLATLTSRTMAALDAVLEKERPDMVLVQGDTTTTFVGSLAAFYRRIPVGHVEAGLRTNDKAHPFPEEINRRLTSSVTDLHFAPTQAAKDALLAEHYPPERIFVTGNTVIDALRIALQRPFKPHARTVARIMQSPRRIVLLTMHRRENWGEPMRGACRAVKKLASRHPEDLFVFPVHLNPVVREVVVPILGGLPNVCLLEPLGYLEFIHLMAKAHLIITDSGGIQEEAPALGKPVLVLREVTERPEAIQFGTARLVGLNEERIFRAATVLLNDQREYRRMANAVNPYGDGKAAQRIVAIIRNYFGFSRKRVAEFRPRNPRP